MGRMLDEYYNDINKIKDLIKLGDLSSLREKINPDSTKTHTFDEPQEDVTVAYHRDRNEDWKHTKSLNCNSLDDLNDKLKYSDIEYIYLYDMKNKKWLWDYIDYGDNKMELKDLRDSLKEITKIAIRSGDYFRIFNLNEVPFFDDLKKTEIQVKVDNDVYDIYQSADWETEKKIIHLMGRDNILNENDLDIKI